MLLGAQKRFAILATQQLNVGEPIPQVRDQSYGDIISSRLSPLYASDCDYILPPAQIQRSNVSDERFISLQEYFRYERFKLHGVAQSLDARALLRRNVELSRAVAIPIYINVVVWLVVTIGLLLKMLMMPRLSESDDVIWQAWQSTTTTQVYFIAYFS